MTSIIAWVGADQRGPASLYVASDSRITWGISETKWDHGRKTFSCIKDAHIFGYSGDVLFPALALPILIDRIDSGMLGEDALRWPKSAYEILRSLWKSYPSEKVEQDFCILHGFRAGEGMAATFHLISYAYSVRKRLWAKSEIPVPATSELLHVGGTGASSIREAQQLWSTSDAAGTSRAIFSGFAEALMGGTDKYSGGPPQLCGMYRKGAAFPIGVWYARKRYFCGLQLPQSQTSASVEWRDHLFRRVDGSKGTLLRGAKQHLPRV